MTKLQNIINKHNGMLREIAILNDKAQKLGVEILEMTEKEDDDTVRGVYGTMIDSQTKFEIFKRLASNGKQGN